jgi:hypothetical protein
MPETLKKLREPAALAAVVFAGLVILVGIIDLLAPPGNGAGAVPFADRAYDETTVFLSLEVAAAVAFAVYLANHAGPAVGRARVITLAALVEVGLAALFGVITALAQFGASGADGESKLLKFLTAAGGAAVVGAAGLFVWLTWQALAPATSPAGGRPAGAFVGGNWPSGPGSTGASGGAAGQYGQSTPPPGGFGWTPQQSAQTPGGQPSSPTAFGQQAGQVPGQGAGYGQPSAQGAPGAPQPFGSDRTQMLPPVQSGQPQPGQPQPGHTGPQPAFGQPPQPGQSGQLPYGQPGQPAYGQPPQPGQPMGQATGLSASGSHQTQPPLPPTMQGYAAEPSPWSPGGPGAPGQHAATQQQGTVQPGQQVPQARTDEQQQDQRPGPFQIGDWRSE